MNDPSEESDILHYFVFKPTELPPPNSKMIILLRPEDFRSDPDVFTTCNETLKEPTVKDLWANPDSFC